MTKAQLLLQNKFEEMKRRNPRITIRAYSKKLGMSSGAVSELLHGKRPLSFKAARQIGDKLALSPEEFELLIGTTGARTEVVDYQRLSGDQFRVISDWWHFAILNLVPQAEFVMSPDWVTDRLGISSPVARDALERIQRLGLVQKNGDGRWERTRARYDTSDDVLDLSVRRAHLQDLELIENSLHQDPIELRDVTSITLALRTEDLPDAKKMLRHFQDEFLKRFGVCGGPEVYRLSTQLFPLTKVRKK